MKIIEIFKMHPIDHQTLQELQILPKSSRDPSILHFFDHTATEGGRDCLREMLLKPKRSLDEIHSFQELLKAFIQTPDAFKVDIPRTYVSAAEAYYASNIAYSMSQDVFQHWFDTWIFSWRNPSEFYIVRSGFTATFRLLKAIEEMITELPEALPELLADDILFVKALLNKKGMNSLLKIQDSKLTRRTIFFWDYFLRISNKKDFRRILDIFYKLDALRSIALTATIHNLQFPFFVANAEQVHFKAEQLWHPLIENAVPNSLTLHSQTPVCMLTGANTSGKTTFLKTCGIAVYLAHAGFPVPAAMLQLTFADRLFTSIHLSDNIALGYSHFFGEVMRIKVIAEALHAQESCFVIIDELFRGTNQEDSLYCSMTVIDGFARKKQSLFMVSTHLEPLLKHYESNVQLCFRCFRTNIAGDDFVNTYQIENGISKERLGQVILRKAGVEELLHG
ncbi:MutS-related protein [Dyadobacter chenhuakuii]|uniref:DNA mismatch repair protein MutS n=1 Tax=Dyadobacter chenhuakuii TaxID=2909339 RepID=A0A9X1TRM4_9BACT|nr:DNA mismatch repair protein MutS [Dyadobacter chenhuakuii]MCF2498114.1 DNA mismatch repair protein MutS [Dyadobacter chenhuakuii]